MEAFEILNTIEHLVSQGKRIFTTSSFQTHSLPLLHIISKSPHVIPVYFIDTGYHFPETLAFKDKVADFLQLEVISVSSDIPKSQQRAENGRLLYATDPETCCKINKVDVADKLLMQFDVWMNGIKAHQSQKRAEMQVFEKAPYNCIRFHPMLDWSSKKIYEYNKVHHLPSHPLDAEGYLSIGCEPCTRKIVSTDDERMARWFGLNKTECGLHVDLIKK